MLAKHLRIGGALLAVAATASSCLSAKRGPPPHTLQIHFSAEPVSLDPSLAEDGASLRVLHNLFDGLTAYDGAGKLSLRAAESHQISRDGRTHTFALRSGAEWSDGRPVRADDFVFAIQRALRPDTPSKLAGMLFPIRGAREFHAGKAPAEGLGLRSEGGGARLIIELERPVSYLLDLLTLPVALPLRLDAIEAGGGKWTPKHPVNGAYKIGAHQPDQLLLLEPNTRHWELALRQSGRPMVALRIVKDETTAANLFEQGQLDVLTRVPSFDHERFRKEGLLRVDPMWATYFLSFNLRRAPGSDRLFRRAVAGAIRKHEVVAVLGSGEAPARSWVPMGLEGHVPADEPVPTGWAAAARAWRGRQKPGAPEIAAGFDTGGRNSLVMEKVQKDLERELGIRVKLSNLDWKSHVKSISTDPPALFRFGWVAAFADPISHLSAFTTGDPNNFSGFANRAYDELVAEIVDLRPGPGRTARIREAQRILVDDEVVVVPLYHYVQTHAVARRVGNFRVNPMGVIRFDELRLEETAQNR